MSCANCWWNSIRKIEHFSKRNCKCSWEGRDMYSQWKHSWDEDYSRATNSGLQDTGEKGRCGDNGSWRRLTVSSMPWGMRSIQWAEKAWKDILVDMATRMAQLMNVGGSSGKYLTYWGWSVVVSAEGSGGIESWDMSAKVTWEFNLNGILGT